MAKRRRKIAVEHEIQKNIRKTSNNIWKNMGLQEGIYDFCIRKQ